MPSSLFYGNEPPASAFILYCGEYGLQEQVVRFVSLDVLALEEREWSEFSY
ncbi:hypothetical protein M3223_07945 [Paenibacillus pasadenensis]|nr:hypothetical protein [Paenibacillus pasadenensis]